MNNRYLIPNWPAPKSVVALTTTRVGGYSSKPYHSFNLALHVGDNEEDVKKNRQQLINDFNLTAEPLWLNQIHSNCVLSAEEVTPHSKADACYSFLPNQVCTILTADCLPILICNEIGNKVAAIHAGWRGLANGIIENTIQSLDETPSSLMAWLGPAISASHYEVGQEVYEVFVNLQKENHFAFTSHGLDHWYLDLYALAKHQLQQLGISRIFGGAECTYSNQNFYSYRRDNITGRMATLIWFTHP